MDFRCFSLNFNIKKEIIMAKKDNTLLYVAGGVAAVYLITRQRQTQQQYLPPPTKPGATWVDVALEYGDDLLSIIFGGRNRGLTQSGENSGISINGLKINEIKQN